MGLLRYAGWGALAGAAGSTALNAATYVDMVARGRPASSTPEQAVQRMADRAGVEIPGDEQTRGNRRSGLGAMLGALTGVGVGMTFGVLRAAGLRPSGLVGAAVVGSAAMAASDGSMVALGVTDPKEWDSTAWLSDALPHLAYGAVTVATLRRLDRR